MKIMLKLKSDRRQAQFRESILWLADWAIPTPEPWPIFMTEEENTDLYKVFAKDLSNREHVSRTHKNI